MANLVVHFEIHASDPQRLIHFYSDLLGWTFSQFGEAPYWSIDTGEGSIGNVSGTSGHGINGGLLPRSQPKPEPGSAVVGCNLVIGVDDVDGLMRRGMETRGHGGSPGCGHAGRRSGRISDSIRTTTSSD